MAQGSFRFPQNQTKQRVFYLIGDAVLRHREDGETAFLCYLKKGGEKERKFSILPSGFSILERLGCIQVINHLCDLDLRHFVCPLPLPQPLPRLKGDQRDSRPRKPNRRQQPLLYSRADVAAHKPIIIIRVKCSLRFKKVMEVWRDHNF